MPDRQTDIPQTIWKAFREDKLVFLTNMFIACCHVEACKCQLASHASFVWSLSDRVVVEWVDLTILKLTANQPSNVASRQQVGCGRWDPLNYFKIVICPIFRGIILQQRRAAVRARTLKRATAVKDRCWLRGFDPRRIVALAAPATLF